MFSFAKCLPGRFTTAYMAFYLAAVSAVITGCDGAPVGEQSSSSNTVSSASATNLAECVAPADSVIKDIATMVDWINAMPKPLTLSCFIASLPRPMYYNATLSTFSAQPSVGRRSPRVFLMIEDLILTVVPDEGFDSIVDPNTGVVLKDPETGLEIKQWDVDGIQLLEVSQPVDSPLVAPQSIKGELKFPITQNLSRNAPFLKISFGEANTLSVCAFCHADETQVEVIDGQPVYRSAMLRNRPNTSVTLDSMLAEYDTCNPALNSHEWYRCEMLDAIYGQGTLVWKDFDENVKTIFDN